jgi:putative endonuclease
MNKRNTGNWYEDMACEYLRHNGARVIRRNYRTRSGEIDIIARDGEYTCFVEVKYRKDSKCGGPEMAVDYRKQRQISKVSRSFLYYILKSDEIPIRYDVIAINGEQGAVSVRWLKNAFDYVE